MSYEDNRSDDRFLLDETVVECKRLQARLAHLESLLKEIADMKIHVKTDPAESRSYYLGLAFQMRDIARKGTGKDYTVKIENGFACGPEGCVKHGN